MVTDRQLDYAKTLCEQLRKAGVRAHVDERSEKLGYKIREAQLQKVPYMVILGDKEVANKTISLRLKRGQVLEGMSSDKFVETLNREISGRHLESLFLPQVESQNQEVHNSSL